MQTVCKGYKQMTLVGKELKGYRILCTYCVEYNYFSLNAWVKVQNFLNHEL